MQDQPKLTKLYPTGVQWSFMLHNDIDDAPDWSSSQPGTHCLRMLNLPRISGNFGNFCKTCFVTLTSTRHADFSCVTELATNHLQELSMHLSIPSKYYGTWLTQSFPLKFTICLEQSNTDSYCQSNIVSDFNTTWRCLTGSITRQCGLSAGKWNFQ